MDAAKSGLSFLAGGGTMGARIAAHDWTESPLGPIAHWPGSLRTSLSLVLNSKFPCFLCWGPDFISFCNDAYLPLLGEKEALGRRFADVWSEAWDTVGPIARRAFDGEASYFEDMPITVQRHGYPEQTWYSFSYSPVRDESGAVGGILCTVFETTGKVQAINGLRDKEQELRQLNEDLAHKAAAHAADRDRVWRLSQDLMAVGSLSTGRFVTVNPALTETFGWNAEEVTRLPFMDLVHPEDKPDVAARLHMLAQGTPQVHWQMRALHKDGSYRWLSWTIMPEGELLYGVGRDITAEKQQAQALRQAEEALRQSQKMEAVGQLTGGLAHDFNNMLAGVAGHLELMKLRLKMGQVHGLVERIDTALGATQRAAALTHRLLAFSRRQALDPRPTDVNALVVSMTDLVKHTAGPALAVETRLEAALWHTFCDPNQLESALLNLANNARDAMPDGGTLLIETANVTLDAAAASQHPGLQPGEHVVISVGDTGSGMTPDVLARAFDPFFTTKPLGQGTGLGLSMVYGFATQSRGHVRIISEAGRGSTVRVTLPRHVTHAPQALSRGSGDGVADAGNGKALVMVVDDEEDIRVVMAEVLEMHGYVVQQAADAHDALRQLQRGTAPDVLVTDIGLPGGMSGRQLADIMRDQLPGLPVLMVTGYAESTVMKNEPLPAQMELLTKPFQMSALLAKVAALCGHTDG
ncbi:MAG: ATP-binding protein [Telluria sp.]